MIFEVTHTTRYAFSRPVFLEPHILRFRPRSDGRQQLRHFELQLAPQPAGITEQTDAEGNQSARAWFNGTTESLVITAQFTVETNGHNPFDYLPEADASKLPIVYAEDVRAHLAPYLCRTKPDAGLQRLATEIQGDCDGLVLPFLQNLNEWIYRNCRNVPCEFGDPHPAEHTLASREGSCRDVAVLFLDVCRAAGLAARFVSGYQEGDPLPTDRQLHAWAEVYVPGGGWRGYDPTHGLAVADRHIAVTASATPRDTMPVTGTFRGTGATSQMESRIELTSRTH
jgi:transglutaminase-like putative cysteine protease